MMGVEVGDHDPQKARKILQEIGFYFRGIDQLWWIKLLVQNVLRDFGEGTEVVIIDDLRYRNEFEALRDLDSAEGIKVYLVHIEVEPRTQALRGAAMDRTEHPSETDLDNIHEGSWDLWIPEESTVEQRTQWIESLIGHS